MITRIVEEGTGNAVFIFGQIGGPASPQKAGPETPEMRTLAMKIKHRPIKSEGADCVVPLKAALRAD